MSKYDFGLVFQLPSEIDGEVYLDRLYEAGCDDASVGIGKLGWIELDFIRAANSALDAINSAIGDVQRAIPDATLKHISPDIVGISEIATIMKCSRQNVRQIINSNSYTFPNPIYSQSKNLWYLSEVLQWCKEREKEVPHLDILLETSQYARAYNNALDSRKIKIDREQMAGLQS